MAIDIFQKAWGTGPGINSNPLPGHPLCPRHGFVIDGVIQDIVGGSRGVSAGSTPGTVSSSSTRGYGVKAREHTATTDYDQLGLDSLLLPTTGCTIVLGYEKTDATNRNSVAFGTEGSAANACNGYIPFSDGIVYWDFGGESGANRVSVGSLLFRNDVWTFTVGPREQAIYQNGIQRVSVVQNPTRTQGNAQFQLGRKQPSTVPSDLAKWKFFWIYHRQLTVREIADISTFPFQWVNPRS